MAVDYLQILAKERLKSWKIRWDTGGGLCVYEKKEIWMGSNREDIALFLHEVAHAKCPKKVCGSCWVDSNTGHNAIWGDKFTNLIRKYMVYQPPQEE